MNTLYCLAPRYTYVDAQTLNRPGFEAGLLDDKSGEVLLLNAELSELLVCFSKPVSITDVTAHFAERLIAPLDEVQAVIQQSINNFMREGVLVTTDFLREWSAHPFPSLPAGTPIGNYTVIRELAAKPPVGVYLVQNEVGKRCVLKKLFIHPKDTPAQIRALRKRFFYEFKLLEQLKEVPLVNPLVAFDSEGGTGAVAYFEGMSLHRFVLGKPGLTFNERLALFSQLLQAVAGLHGRQVLHGDLHHGNVLVNRRQRLRLIDFDLAFFWRDRNSQKVRYGGITEFIPPERLTDDVFHHSAGPPDYRAEVYQVGVLGYFIFHGKLPFEEESWRDQIAAIRGREPRWADTLPEAIRQILHKALHKNPVDRYATARSLQAALQKITQLPA